MHKPNSKKKLRLPHKNLVYIYERKNLHLSLNFKNTCFQFVHIKKKKEVYLINSYVLFNDDDNTIVLILEIKEKIPHINDKVFSTERTTLIITYTILMKCFTTINTFYSHFLAELYKLVSSYLFILII